MVGVRRRDGAAFAAITSRFPGQRHQTKQSILSEPPKDKAFARSVSREDIVEGAQGLGIDLDGHIEFCIRAMRESAAELGLAGS
jgi:predicted hydrolase (HD superfamily)